MRHIYVLSFALFQNAKIDKMAYRLLLEFFITFGAFSESGINSLSPF